MRKHTNILIRTICIFVNLHLFVICTTAQSDSTASRHSLIAEINYPVPASGSTFSRIYDGVVDARLGYTMKFRKKIISAGIGYSYFRISPKVLDITGKMTILSPGITAGYDFIFLKKIFFRPLITSSYDYISFSAKDVDGNSLSPYHQGGVSLLPSVSAGYFIGKRVGVGINGGYEIIFMHFGKPAVYEESTTRIIYFGINLQYKL